MNDSEIIYSLTKNMELNMNNDENRIPDNERKTYNKMTKFEEAKLMGIIATNISYNNETNEDPLELAIKEVNNNNVIYLIKRNLPNGKYELWKPNELIRKFNYNDKINI